MAIHLRQKHGIEVSGATPKSAQTSTSNPPVCSPQPSISGLQMVAKPQQPSLKQMFQAKLGQDCKRAKEITKKITILLATDMRPFTLVDNKAFKDLLECLEPRYHVPSRVTFSQKHIPALYHETCDQLKQKLKHADTLAITTDGWTSRATQSYITITVHYIDDEWNLQSAVLQTRPMFESHTGNNSAEVLRCAVDEWQLKRFHGIQPVTSDGAANMGVACREGNFKPHIKCFAHTINLAAQQALKIPEVQRLIGRIKRIVNFFHKSTTAAHLLTLKQELLQLPKHKLLTEVKTRWNSAYDMIQRYLEQQAAVMAVLVSQEVRKDPDLDTLSPGDITSAEQLVLIMEPLKTITTILCEEHQPTISMVMPLLNNLMSSLSPSDGDPKTIKSVKQALLNDLKKRYQEPEIRDILLQATVLDPRFKTLPFLQIDERLHAYAKVVHLTDSINKPRIKVEKEENTQPGKSQAQATEPALPALEIAEPVVVSDSEDVAPPAKKAALDTLLGDVYVLKEEPATKSQQQLIEQELDKYKQLDPLNLSHSPLDWWRENQYNFPHLGRAARHLLCIPATSVTSERVFSTAGDVVSAQRAALSPEHVDMLVFLKKNIKLC